MFQYLDSSLFLLLKTELKSALPTVPDVYFMTPDASFPGSLSLPAINLFLFSIQENRDLRATDRLAQRLATGQLASPPAPVRIDCHYLVTAYAATPEGQPSSPLDEHWILGETMRVLMRYPELPPQYLTGPLSLEGLPVRADTALPPTRETSTDLWHALGQRPREIGRAHV